MIEVNLLPGKRRKAAGGGFSFKLDIGSALANLRTSVKDPWLLGAIAAWGLVLGIGGFLYLNGLRVKGNAEERLEAVRAEKRRFDVVIAQKRQAEKIRDSLVAELNVIRQIDADRYVWPHVLDQVTKALPPYTWLTDVSTMSPVATQGTGGAPPPVLDDSLGGAVVRVSITGRTVDIQAYTTFLRQLANSPWFTDVMPVQSSTVIEADRPVTQFNVTLRYRVADSTFIRTVPIVSSAR
jgi:Tfp pilus assembly protein PilN